MSSLSWKAKPSMAFAPCASRRPHLRQPRSTSTCAADPTGLTTRQPIEIDLANGTRAESRGGIDLGYYCPRCYIARHGPKQMSP
jgi:hypothetical protein